MTHRRAFLKDCSLLAVAVAASPLAGLASPTRQTEVDLQDLPFGAFAGQLHSAFRAGSGPDERVSLKLVEARPTLTRSKPNLPDAAFEKFSLLFRGPQDRRLVSAIHRFEHPSLGCFNLFIVPILARDQTHAYYEAVFNRPTAGPMALTVA